MKSTVNDLDTNIFTIHFSLISPSWMVVSSRELTNILSSSSSLSYNTSFTIINNHQELSPMNIEVKIPKKWYHLLSINSQRNMLVGSYTSFMNYAERIKE